MINLTDQGIINFLYAEVKSFLEQHGYVVTLPNIYECLKLVIGSAGTVLEDSQPYLDDKLEKL